MKILKLLSMVMMAILSCPETMCDGAVVLRPQIYKVTAYCACAKCCGTGSPGVTASGHKIQPGDMFVAAPKSMPLKTTWVIVPGYNDGQAVPVLDRGGKITEGCIDVFFKNHQLALRWGVRYPKVVVIKTEPAGGKCKR